MTLHYMINRLNCETISKLGLILIKTKDEHDLLYVVGSLKDTFKHIIGATSIDHLHILSKLIMPIL